MVVNLLLSTMEEDAVELNKKIDELTLTVNRLSNNFENYVSSSGNVNPVSIESIYTALIFLLNDTPTMHH